MHQRQPSHFRILEAFPHPQSGFLNNIFFARHIFEGNVKKKCLCTRNNSGFLDKCAHITGGECEKEGPGQFLLLLERMHDVLEYYEDEKVRRRI